VPVRIGDRRIGAMKTERALLLIDAAIDLALGVLLIVFPTDLVSALGVPATDQTFYASILGAVLFGIGIALLIERSGSGGLGLQGAVAINLSGGVVLALWLVLGDLRLPFRGFAFLWGLAVVLIGVSLLEILASRRGRDRG